MIKKKTEEADYRYNLVTANLSDELMTKFVAECETYRYTRSKVAGMAIEYLVANGGVSTFFAWKSKAKREEVQ